MNAPQLARFTLVTLRMALCLGLASAATGTALDAQTEGTCVPVAERGDRTLGCFITAREELGRLSTKPPLFWHLDTYTTRAAAEKARGPRSTVVESLGQTWLFTIAPANWRAHRGKRFARVGPLPIVKADSIAAVYMEGVFAPGMQTVVHRHDGAEAWVTLEGSMCLETPRGKLEQRAGQKGVFVEPHIPMMLTGTGAGVRRSLVLILQDATKPRSTAAPDWTPKNLCSPRSSESGQLARVRRELEARYAQNAAAFIARDTTAVYRLRAPEFHTETPDGRTHSFTDMRAYTDRLFTMIERFDTLNFRIDSLSLRGDTAVAIAFQESSRLQHLPNTPADERHRVAAKVIQREQWVRSPGGWLLWRVDQIRDQGLWIDGVLRRPPTP